MAGQVAGLCAFLINLFISHLGGLLIKFAGKRKLVERVVILFPRSNMQNIKSPKDKNKLTKKKLISCLVFA